MKKEVIGINLVFCRGDFSSGINNHARDILTGFDKISVLDNCLIFVRDTFYEVAVRNFPNATIVRVDAPKFMKRWGKTRMSRGIKEIFYLNYGFRKTIKGYNIKCMLHTFNHFCIRFDKSMANIMVIHDMQYKNFPDTIKKMTHIFANRGYKYFAKESDALVTISEYAKEDIGQNLLREVRKKYFEIVVIPNSVEIAYESGAPKEAILQDKPYVLFVGMQAKHKNHITLVKAFNLLKGQMPHNLVLVGERRKAASRLEEYVKQNRLGSRIEIFADITDNQLVELYKNCSLFVSPSLYEGFGRPPVEAAMCLAPVLVSEETSLPEVTCGRVKYYSPATDEEALAKAILEIIENPPSQEARRETAELFKAKYRTEKIAWEYMNLIDRIIHEKDK